MTLMPTSSTWFDEISVEAGTVFLEDLIAQAAESVQPYEPMTVAEAAAKYRYLNNGAAYQGPWLHEKTPYLEEPMEEMTNKLLESVIFAGPAQCGKTELFLNYLVYCVMCDPADLMLVQTAQATARLFSITKVDRMHEATGEVGRRVLIDNTFDKQYTNGMMVQFAWPTNNELSGKTVPRVFLTDLDRMPENVDGEGNAYLLAKARTTSFKKHGKTIAESSPGYVIKDPSWARRTPHEAPPTGGILALYNTGDRRRWYWRCVKCKFSFEPHWSLLVYPKTDDPLEAGEAAYMQCPHCQMRYSHDYTSWSPSKEEMNIGGKWVKEGNVWTPDNKIVGIPRRSNVGSFWLNGVAATFNSWKQLVTDYLNAEAIYQDTGAEEELKTVVNTKIGMPYLAKAQAMARIADQIKSRARDYGDKVVPHGVRFLIANIDVQKNRFEVQIHGIGEKDIWVIDRFAIKFSKREDEDTPGQLQRIDPGAYAEDWRHILAEVQTRSYPLAGDETRHMGVYFTLCDSGGSEGFTANAYEYYRWLMRGYVTSDGEILETDEMQEQYPWLPGFAARFMLLKGESKPGTPRFRITYPDAQKKDRHADARGEIPVAMLNTITLKNQLDGILDRREAGGRINFPNWLPLSFYKELTVETKNKDGKWENLTGHRNESWDLLVYCLAALLHPNVMWEHINWAEPPDWAKEWDDNSMVFSISSGETPFDGSKTDALDALAELGAKLNG